MTEPHQDLAESVGREAASIEDLGDEQVDDRMDADELRNALEALLLVVDSPVSVEQLAHALDEPPHRVREAVTAWAAELDERGSGMELRHNAEGWRLYSRAEFAPYVEQLLLDGARSKLTRAALETLAVIAYRQPATRSAVSAIRGVNVDAVIRTLLARGLIVESGHDPDAPAASYVTTELFLERMGLVSLDELPPIAPLMPEIDIIDDISADLEADPRFAKLAKPAAVDDSDLLREAEQDI